MKRFLLSGVALAVALLALGLSNQRIASAQVCGDAVEAVGPADACVVIPRECYGMTFDYFIIGSDQRDVIQVIKPGRYFIDTKGGDDYIYVNTATGHDCIVGGPGIDTIYASLGPGDVCLTGGDSRVTTEGTIYDSTRFCETVSPLPPAGSGFNFFTRHW